MTRLAYGMCDLYPLVVPSLFHLLPCPHLTVNPHRYVIYHFSSVPSTILLLFLWFAFPTSSVGDPNSPLSHSLLKSTTTASYLPYPAHYASNGDSDHADATENDAEDSLSYSTLCESETALGMESEHIPDSALTASSAFEMLHVGPHNARLRKDKAGGAWCPSKQLGPDTSGSEWIQVDLGNLHVLTGVATQGRYGKGLGQEFTEWYNILYSREAIATKWIKWKSLDGRSNLEGNIDPNTVEEHHLELPIVGVRHIRLVPLSNHTRTVCLRFELYGCSYQGPISYTLPAVSKSFPNDQSQLLDLSYDGSVSESGLLYGGLGQLVDGIKASAQDVGSSDEESSHEYVWVGWPPTNHSNSSSVTLIFEFAQVSNFTTLSINCRNSYNRNIRAFSLALVWFSLDNQHWSETPISFDYQADNVIELPRDIIIHLQYRIGKFVRLELTHKPGWLQLSEVAFHCQPLSNNLTDSQIADLFENAHLVGYRDGSSGGTRYVMPEDNALHNNHTLDHQGKAVYPVQHDAYGQTVKYSLIIACLCTLGLVIISLLTSMALKKLNNRKSSVFREISEADLDSENADINLKSLPKDGSHLYCDPKELSSIQDEAEYAVPDVICPSNLSKTLNFQKAAPTTIACKTLQLNPRFYASSDIIHPKQNIYGTRPCPQILNVFDIANLRAVNQPQYQHQKKLSHQQTPLLNTFAGSKVADRPFHNQRSSIYGDVINGTFGVRVYSESEIGVLQRLGKSKFGDVLLCNIPAAGKNRLVVVRTVNDLNLKAEFVKSMEYMRKLSQNCDKFARLFGIIDTPSYFASITEHADCDLNHFLRKPNSDMLSFDTLLYLASEIANACAYLESSKQTHQDIATRNVIVYEKNLTVKLTDVGQFLDKYAADYYNTLPIRWMSPEAIARTQFTVRSDVYAFGVCFWEILTYAKCRPFAEMSDEEFLSSIYAYIEDDEEIVRLPKPSHCSNEIFELLEECCDPSESQRPSFTEISIFLQRKTLGFQKPIGF